MLRRNWLWISLVFLLGAVSALGGIPPRATANVTLISFTAASLNGQPGVYVSWETATEIDVAGFYVQRSLTNQADSYTNVSSFYPAAGDNVTGAGYDWVDETTTLNTGYYYRLLEIPADAAGVQIQYSPVWVMAGVAVTPIPPTPTSTPRLIYAPLIAREN
jgi:hypothetical protein